MCLYIVRLAKVKADVRKRRSEREKIEKAKEIELERRKLKLEDLFNNFHIESSGRIEIEIVGVYFSFSTLTHLKWNIDDD